MPITSSLRDEPQLLPLGQFPPSVFVLGEPGIASLGMDGEARLNFSNRGGEGENICARKKKELPAKCLYFTTWCVTAFGFGGFFIPNDFGAAYEHMHIVGWSLLEL